MTNYSTIELRDLKLQTQIGTYGPNDVVPNAHLLDLTLRIPTDLVLIQTDGMHHVVDYDPLVAEIDRLAQDGHYETQERLMTRIAAACANYPQIISVEIMLKKMPVLGNSGTLGVRTSLDENALSALRTAA